MPSLKKERCTFVILLATAIALSGCSLRHYRSQADKEAYATVAEKSDDPRWDQPGFTIELDPRSRYFDGYDPDREPMPRDDPAAARYMYEVDGKKGWSHWWDNGVTDNMENPYWREQLSEYAEISEDGKLILSVDSALRIAYLNSPTYQDQLETLYLSALDVSTERFRFDTQFFAGNRTTFEHLGRLRGPGGETNTLETVNDGQMSRRLATGGELLAGFANSFVWQFAGPDTNSSLTILNFNLVQPLLRSAGRERALEQLTRVERGLLSNLRQLERYRKGFYSQVAIGQLGVGGVSRLGGFTGGTGLTGFTGTGQGGLGGVGQATGFGGGFFGGGAGGAGVGGGTGLAGGGAGQVGGFVGLLQTMQEIRNSQYSLDLQLRTLALLEANLEAGTIDLTQVDQFRQNIETTRAQLLQARAGLQGGLDSYKTGILGLPPDLGVELDDEFIRQFQLIDPRIVSLQDEITRFQDDLGNLPINPSDQQMGAAIAKARILLEDYREQFPVTQRDIEWMRTQIPEREAGMTAPEKRMFQLDVERLTDDFSTRPEIAAGLEQGLQNFERSLSPTPGVELLPQLVGWTRALSDEVQSLNLIQARARLEAVVVEAIELDAPNGLRIARANRLDYMNNRAALVDSWRLIAFNADQLQSVLDIELDGDLRTVGDNPVKFRGPTGRMTARVEFDAPLTRLLERNNYRQALIDYQRSRRRIVGFDDSLNETIRSRLRTLEQLRVNLEIQRRAVVISIRRVDFTRSELNRPLPPPVPGEAPATFGPTAVQNLLSALSDLSNAQNAFMSVWLNYYSERMLLARDLGIMRLDEQGRWIDEPLPASAADVCLEPASEALPPGIPSAFWDTLDQAEQRAAVDEQSEPAPRIEPQLREASIRRDIQPNPHISRSAARVQPTATRLSGSSWAGFK